MSAADRDAEFAAFLERRTVLPDTPDRLEPPANLDELILTEARQAIQAQRRPVRTGRWARPMALAATILLCLSIVLNVALNKRRPVVNESGVTVASAGRSAGSAPVPAPAAPLPDAAGADASSQAPSSPLTAAAAPELESGNRTLNAPAQSTASRLLAKADRPASSEPPPPPHPKDPKVWLQRIEALRAQGRTAQADAEMQRFRAAFPTYPAKPTASGTR